MDIQSIEKEVVWPLEEYCSEHADDAFNFKYPDGEEYVVRFWTAYDTEDEEYGDPGYQEYHEIAYKVIKTVVDGHRLRDAKGPMGQFPIILVNYKDIPSLVKAGDGTVVYQA